MARPLGKSKSDPEGAAAERRDAAGTSPRGRPATLRDVALLAGTSSATASLALNGDPRISPATRQLVLHAAERLRYHANPIAQGLSRGWRDRLVGVFTMGLDLGSRTRSITLIQAALNAEGFEVPVHVYGAPARVQREGTLGQDMDVALRNLCAQRPRAVVCNTSSDLSAEALEELRRYQEQGGIVVCYDHEAGLDSDRVVFDREGYTYHSAAHLLGLGHRDLLLGPSGRITPEHSWARGFLRALADWGVAPRDGWLLEGGQYEDGGLLLARQFLALPEPRPTAICVINDQSAAAFVHALLRAGVRVPEDVSVVGHDDSPAARAAMVPLTTVRRPVEEIAGAVVTLLLDRLVRGENGPARVVPFAGTLTVRQSTAAASPPRSRP